MNAKVFAAADAAFRDCRDRNEHADMFKVGHCCTKAAVGAALREAAAEVVASCPDHGQRDEAWMDCHCVVGDWLLLPPAAVPVPDETADVGQSESAEQAAVRRSVDAQYPAIAAFLADETAGDETGEVKRLRAELASYKDELDALHRHTLPQLRREIQHHQDGKKRWRDRAEKAEPERDGLKARLFEAAMARVWTNEDGKKFVFVDDLTGPLLGITPKAGE